MAETLTADQVRRLALNRDLSDAKAAQVLGINEDAVRKWRAAHAKEGTVTELTNETAPVVAPTQPDPAPAEPIATPTPIENAPSAKATKGAKPSKARAANAAISAAAKGKAAAKSGKAEKKAPKAKAAAKATKAPKAKGAPRAKGSDEYATVRAAVTEEVLKINRAQREDIFKGKTDAFRLIVKETGNARAEVRAPALKLAKTSDSNVKFQRRLIRRDLEARKELAVE